MTKIWCGDEQRVVTDEQRHEPTRHGPMEFSHKMAVYARPNRHDIFISMHPCHVFISTFGDLSSELSIDSIRARKDLEKDPSFVLGSILTQMGPQWQILSFCTQ